MAEQMNHRGNFLWGFVVGSLLGAMAGLFLAPKSGKELRSDLKEKGSEAFEGLKQTYTETEQKAKAILEDSLHRVEALKREVDHQLAEARRKAREILASRKKDVEGSETGPAADEEKAGV